MSWPSYGAGQEHLGAAVARDALEKGQYAGDPGIWGQLVFYRDFEVDDLDVAIAELRRADCAAVPRSG